MADQPQTGFVRSVVWQRLRLVTLGGAAAVLIVLVVLASRSVTVESDGSQVNQGPVIAAVHAVEILGIAIEILAVVLWLVLSRMAKQREVEEDTTYHEPPKVHWLIRVLLMAIPLCVLGLLIYALYRFSTTRQSQSFDFGGLLAPVAGNNGTTTREISAVLGLAWWEYGISIFLVVLVLAVGVWALRRDVAPSITLEEGPSRAQILSQAVDLGLDEARSERDPRKAVIAAYSTMERILAGKGLPRRRTEAPLEYMSRLFAELGIRSESIHTLTDLFELARFSHHHIAPAMKERAIVALETLKQELRPVP